jgi:hypothetical protein
LEFDLEGTEEGDIHGAFGADPRGVPDWRTSGTKISPKKELHKVKRTVQVKRMTKKYEQRSNSISETKLELCHSFVDSNPQTNIA